MREILFRGKRCDNDEWVEGGYHRQTVGEDLTAVFIIENQTIGVRENHRVDPSTVGQYIGITDKTGKKIFEGDIVKAYNIFGKEDGIGVVHWSELFSAWHCARNKCMYSYEVASYEVIGNIHDNPELWEGDER